MNTYRFSSDQKGASFLEYVLLVSMIAVAVLSTIYLIGAKLDERYEDFAETVETINQSQ